MAQGSRHRKAIVQSAVKLFREKGYAATGLNEILADSGAPKGSLYHHFPGGKEELGKAAVKAAGEVVTETLRSLAKSETSPAQFVRAYADLLARWMEQSRYTSGCPISTTLLEMAPTSSLISAAGAEAMNDWIAVIEDVYAHTEGRSTDAKDQAVSFIAAIEGALILAKTLRSTGPIRAVEKQFAGAGA